jgi:hypothetical protein
VERRRALLYMAADCSDQRDAPCASGVLIMTVEFTPAHAGKSKWHRPSFDVRFGIDGNAWGTRVTLTAPLLRYALALPGPGPERLSNVGRLTIYWNRTNTRTTVATDASTVSPQDAYARYSLHVRKAWTMVHADCSRMRISSGVLKNHFVLTAYDGATRSMSPYIGDVAGTRGRQDAQRSAPRARF